MTMHPLVMHYNCVREYITTAIKHWKRRAGLTINPLSHVEKRCRMERKYHKQIFQSQAGHDLIREAIDCNRPTMIARFGSIELSCIAYYLRHGGFASGRTYVSHIREEIIQNMGNLPGFFPLTDHYLDKFCEHSLEHVSDVDVMCVWYNDYEYAVCNKYCPNAALVDLYCLEPFRFQHPWSYLLKGKKVLVVHPFAESITRQFGENRQRLWNDPEVLPDFDLKTVKAIVSIGGAAVPFATWFDAFDSMCEQISKVDFDISIIGAGSYGLPLASFIKRMGKTAIHMGGVSQILFGIRGKRWETEYGDVPIYRGNEYWCRPSPSETVSDHTRFENGCYW